jgi:drug/metabolite transporter (DMT)-like permease
MIPTDSSRRLRVAVALALVYVIWGGSYVATKSLVTDMPPLLTGGIRFMVAGTLITALARWRGAAFPASRTQYGRLVVLALLGVFLNNAPHVVAMQHVASNQAALLNATPALWIAWLGTFGRNGHPLDAPTQSGLALGCVGVVLLLLPHDASALQGLGWQLVILLACLVWSLATVYQRSAGIELGPMMIAGLTMLLGGAMLATAGLLHGDAATMHWTPPAAAGFLWLTLLSSCVAYTAYSYLIASTTPAVVGSYGYVNPVIAALAGWLVLGETLTPLQVAGMLIVLAGVAIASGFWPRRAFSPAG